MENWDEDAIQQLLAQTAATKPSAENVAEAAVTPASADTTEVAAAPEPETIEFASEDMSNDATEDCSPERPCPPPQWEDEKRYEDDIYSSALFLSGASAAALASVMLAMF